MVSSLSKNHPFRQAWYRMPVWSNFIDVYFDGNFWRVYDSGNVELLGENL
jgi:hypothetical protein